MEGCLTSEKSNLNTAVMIVNYIQVYQQSGSNPIGTQAATNTNQTGVGGAVGLGSRGSRIGVNRSIVATLVFIILVVQLELQS